MRKERNRKLLWWLLLMAALLFVALIPAGKHHHALAANTCWVTFDPCGGRCSTEKKQVTVGGTYGTLPKATRDGYTFLGWFSSPGSAGTEVISTTKVNATMNHKIYAHWKALTCTVTFNNNGGYGNPGTKTYNQGSTFGSLPSGTTPPTGKHFIGWFSASSGGSQYATSSTVPYQSSLTMYAHYDWNTYSISFNGNGSTGGSTSGMRCTYGTTYTLTSNGFSKTGYTFTGWNTAANGSGTSYSNGQRVSNLVSSNNGSITLYAQWKRNYCNVSFNNNGGYGTPGNQSYAQGSTFGSLPAGTTPPTGKHFVGWFSAASGGSQYSTSSTVPYQSSLTMYAHYDWNTYSISFNGNGSTGGSTSGMRCSYGTTYTLTSNGFSKTGYTFTGWNTAANGSGTSYSNGQKVSNLVSTNNGSITLYAQWKRNTVNVSFDANGGYGTVPNQTYTIGSTYGSLPAGTTPPTGHAFKGWFTAKSGGTQITTSSTVSASYTTLYAQYSAKAYTISYKSDGGMTFSDSIVVYGTPYNIPHTPVRKYYTFLGWFTAEDGGNKVVASTIMNTAANHTLYAHWKRNTVTVTFDNNGGAGNVPSKTYDEGTTYGSLPAGPTPPTGYSFSGWYTAKSGGTKISTSSTVDPSYKTLYAHYSAKTYTVTFDSTGGSSVSSIKVTFGNAYGTLPVPTMTNAIFLGWFTAKSGGTQITDATKVSTAANHTLYAQWHKNVVVVSFNVNGGYGNIPVATYDIGSKYGSLPAGPTPPTGHSFKGWFTAKSGGTQIKTTSTVSASYKTLYAQYSAKAYTISYKSDGGMTFSDSIVVYGTPYNIPHTPVRKYYTFLGWYTAETGGTKVETTDIMKTAANHTLYAHWKRNTVNVSFNVNGGYGAIPSKTYNVGDTYGSLPAGPTPQTGYAFAGWFTAKTGGTEITTSSTVFSTRTVLYAQYTAKTYTVSFNANGGSAVSTKRKITYGTAYGTLPTTTLTYHTFLGWYTAKDGGTRITDTTKLSLAADHTLYAHWKRNTVNVSFNVNGGYGNIPNRTYNVGDTYGSFPAAPTPPQGHSFVGWFTAKSGGTRIYSTTQVYSSRTVLYAHYSANSYKVSFDANGGTKVSSTRTITYGTAYGTLPTTSRTYHTFLGWYTAKEGGNKITDTTNLSLAVDHTLYAHWKRNTVNVSFNVNGGYGNIPNRTYNVGDTYGSFPAAPTPPQGHSFVGWFTAKSGGTRIYSTTLVYSSRTVLYAQYTANPYTVSFDANGGDAISTTKKITFGTAYGSLPVPYRIYHTFQGWYTAKESGTRITETTTLSLAANHTLYAHWKRNTVTVSFNSNGGYGNVPVQTYNVGDPYGKLPIGPTPPSGLSFLGWYTKAIDGDLVTEKTIVLSSRKCLYAHFGKAKWKVTFDSDGGSAVMQKTVIFGKAYGTLGTPTKSGYKFLGWYTAKSGGSPVTGTTIVSINKDHILYARWGKYVTVTFKAPEGMVYQSTKKVACNEQYGQLLAAVRPGYVFAGWYTAPDGRGTIVNANTLVTTTTDHNLYAKWIAQDSFTINDLLDLSGDDPNEYVPPQNMSHNIYNNPDLTSTSKEFTGFLIDFYTNSSAKGTYWALCNWTMDTSCLTRKGMTNIHYHFASSAYAGLQFTNDDAKCNIAFWRIDYTDPAGNDCYQNVNPTVVKGFSGKTMGTYDNEGSGYNYLKKFNWKAGKWYRMYLGCFTGDNGNTYVEYWIKDISANKWTHIVTIDTNLQDSFFTGSMYQFMENFSSDTCNSVRTLAYKNIFVRERSTGSWKSIISSTLSTKETNKKKGKVAFGSNSTTLYGITSGYGCPNNSAGKGMSLKVPMLSNTVSPDTPY